MAWHAKGKILPTPMHVPITYGLILTSPFHRSTNMKKRRINSPKS